MKYRSFTLIFVFQIFLIFISGCGRGISVEYVEGKVTYKGEPIKDANVVFVPEPGSLTALCSFGTTDSNGRYRLTCQQNITAGFGKGTPQGDYQVTISKVEGGYDKNAVDKSPEEQAELMRKLMAGTYTPKIVPPRNVLPMKYDKTETSGLRVTVAKGKNLDMDFDLID